MAKINPGKYAIYFASLLLIVSFVFAGLFRRPDVFVLTAGVALVSHGSGQPMSMTVMLAAVATFLGTFLPMGVTSNASIQGFEGFADPVEDFEDEEFEDGDEKFEDGDEKFEDEGFEDEAEGFEDAPKKKKKTKRRLPDNGKRAEMFELGKKYKLPSESDDDDFHLDAGTTFMNAYKSLKPDQISAMTKDTQDLINTQKQLMSTLHTLKPLISDGKQMMDTFQGYFGSEGVGNLGAMADKFVK
jgi:hypothetical protein